MSPWKREHARASSAILPVTWGSTVLLVAFAIENLWFDDVVRARWQRLPSLVPAQASPAWALAVGLMVAAFLALLVLQILTVRDRTSSRAKKWGTGGLLLTAFLLFGLWIWATGVNSFEGSAPLWPRKHALTPNWNASTSKVISRVRSDVGLANKRQTRQP